MKRISEWWYAYLVCRKYGLIWNTFYPSNSGAYSWDIGIVSVNPFRNNFISVFMHEVGHHVHHKQVNYNYYLKSGKGELQYDSKGWSVYKNLEAEWKASRFSVKCGKGDKKFLTSCFNTYTAEIFGELPNPCILEQLDSIIDASHRGWLKINK